ncbi:MAG: restriction endonuclease subunit S [Gammaproteobacteria bacterium]|nr:restriction endonuclease subunit S [Gammaproteobacteria bacterium]
MPNDTRKLSTETSPRTSRTGGRAATTGVIPGRFALSVGNPDLPSPHRWRWELLTNLARLETGHTPSRRHPEYWDGDIPWIGIKDAAEHHGRDLFETAQYVTQQGIDNSAARVLPRGTVCLSRTASIGYITRMGVPMATSQDFVNWVCGPKLDSRLLLYLLLSEVESLSRFAYGTTHQTIYFPEVKAFHVCVPPRAEQRSIAGILRSLDEKIEQNNRLAQALERLARAIFRAWFVDFEPVKAKATGAASFPSMPQLAFDALPTRFIDTEIGPVPEAWEVKGVASIATFLNGLALQKYPPRDDGEDLRVIKIAELRKGSAEGSAWANGDVAKRYVIGDGDLLFSWSGTLEAAFWFGGKGALNQHLFKVTSSRFPSWFCFHWIRQHLPWFRAIAASKATTMGHIKRGHLQETLVVVPPTEILHEANEVIGPMYDLFGQLMIESRTLAAMRDALLPKLLSGEVRVKVDGEVDSES